MSSLFSGNSRIQYIIRLLEDLSKFLILKDRPISKFFDETIYAYLISNYSIFSKNLKRNFQ